MKYWWHLVFTSDEDTVVILTDDEDEDISGSGDDVTSKKLSVTQKTLSYITPLPVNKLCQGRMLDKMQTCHLCTTQITFCLFLNKEMPSLENGVVRFSCIWYISSYFLFPVNKTVLLQLIGWYLWWNASGLLLLASIVTYRFAFVLPSFFVIFWFQQLFFA